jgi:hypothetical protein
MMKAGILIGAAAAGFGVLLAAPGVATAFPLSPIGSELQVTTVAKESGVVEKAAKRYYKKRRYARYPRYKRYRYGRCWNCGYGYGAPFYFGIGIPFYAPYYGYYGDYYGYYPRYRYNRYWRGPAYWTGGKRR